MSGCTRLLSPTVESGLGSSSTYWDNCLSVGGAARDDLRFGTERLPWGTDCKLLRSGVTDFNVGVAWE